MHGNLRGCSLGLWCEKLRRDDSRRDLWGKAHVLEQSVIQGAQAAAESAQRTQPAQSRKRKRPAADSRSEKNGDDAEFLKGKTDAEKRALLKRLMDDLDSQ